MRLDAAVSPRMVLCFSLQQPGQVAKKRETSRVLKQGSRERVADRQEYEARHEAKKTRRSKKGEECRSAGRQ